MDLAKRAILFLVIMAVFLSSTSIVHKVGDSAGWTAPAIGHIDYSKWATTRAFHIHDIIVFEYDARNHNVMQVSLSDFRSCNRSAPMSTYSTGNDSITINSPGHYYYLCGFPGHCQAGLKVDIRVPKNAESTTNSTTLVPGDASMQFTPDEYPNGTMAPDCDSPLNAAHCLVSSTWFLSNELGLPLFFLGLYLLGTVY